MKIAFHPRSGADAAPRSPFGFLRPAGTPEDPRPSFDYDVAFGRNLGWVTPAEQRMLRDKRVAIAGMGGVGGAHVLTFARLGIGHMHLADFDDFDLPNLNRQAGAFVGTLGRPKAEVMAAMGGEINPELDIVRFDQGIGDEATAEAFLDGCDLFVDGLDFFVLDMRRKLFARAYEKGIPAITAAPLGTGTAWLVFEPGKMSFEEYFRLGDDPLEHQYVKFLVGLAPKAAHRPALVSPASVNFADRAGPSTTMGCQMASAVVGAESLKILLHRGRVRTAPAFQQFDPYTGRLVVGQHRGGNAHPAQRLRIALARRWIERIAPRQDPLADSVETDAPALDRILDLARWAPSGDNDQPWRFEVLGEDQVRVHVRHVPGENVYEYGNGRPVWLGVGALLETLRLAASLHGRHCYWEPVEGRRDAIDVSFVPGPDVRPARLAGFVKARSVDRRPYRAEPLDSRAKAALEAAWGENFEIRWLESPSERWAATRLNMRATHIRLRIPECHRVHRRVVHFGTRHAAEGMPAGSVGLDPMTVRLMRWANARWWRTRLLNRWLGGARTASLQLDVLPGLSCGAHFAVAWRDPDRGRSVTDWLEAGAAMQRFWLEATAQGLALQPSFAPIIFAHYAEAGTRDWEIPATAREAGALARRFRRLFGRSPDDFVFAGRIGRPRGGNTARSIRLPLDALTTDR